MLLDRLFISFDFRLTVNRQSRPSSSKRIGKLANVVKLRIFVYPRRILFDQNHKELKIADRDTQDAMSKAAGKLIAR